MAASGVAKCSAGFGVGVLEPDTAGGDGAAGASGVVRAGGVVADAIGTGASAGMCAAPAGLDRPSPQPATARARARPAATPSNERLVGANVVGLIGRPLSAGSGAARKGR